MDKYEVFKKQVYSLTGIDLSSYKEKQMKRRIQSLVTRNKFTDFDDYFNGLKSGYAIKIKDFKKYENPLNLRDLNIFYTPQSFVYIELYIKYWKKLRFE